MDNETYITPDLPICVDMLLQYPDEQEQSYDEIDGGSRDGGQAGFFTIMFRIILLMIAILIVTNL